MPPIVRPIPDEAITAMHALGMAVDPAMRCNTAAVQAGDLDLTHPSLRALRGFAKRDDTLIVTVRNDADVIVGYGILTDDQGGRRGGGYLRWLVLDSDLTAAETVDAVRQIRDSGLERFGKVWGRVTHPTLHGLILEIPGVDALESDPEVLVSVSTT